MRDDRQIAGTLILAPADRVWPSGAAVPEGWLPEGSRQSGSGQPDPLRDGRAHPGGALSAAEDAALWAGFAGARSAAEFCETWLALQCREIAGATAGLLLLREGTARFTPAAVWPDRSRDMTHLVETAQAALTSRSGSVVSRPGAAQVAYPIEVGGRLHGVVVVEVTGQGQDALRRSLRRLHWGVGWLETLFRRRDTEQDQARIARTGMALDLLASAAEQTDQKAAGFAVTATLAGRLNCSRVSMGVVRGRRIRLLAMSHQATFQQRTQLADAIENAMEEAFDQDAAVAHPATPDSARRIALAQADLARHAGSLAVASLPLASAGRPVGVLTVERERGPAFTDDELAQVAAVAVALGPLVEARGRAQRLVAGRLIDAGAAGVKALTGPRRPGLKLAAVALIGVAVWLSFATGEFRVSARAVIEGTVERAAVAPFAGFIAAAPVRAGDVVEAGQVLAELDARELALEAARWQAERDQQALKYQEAIGKQDRTQARVLAAQQKQAEAQLALVEDKIARAVIRAPFRGLVVSGDLSQQLGAPVEIGKVLFEIAPLDSFRAVLSVEERDVAWLTVGGTGALRLAGRVSEPVAATITKITPVATTEDGANTFRVEADLGRTPDWVRPGMEGVAKVGVGERGLVWVWTRSLVDWARLAVWKWLP